MSSNLEVEAKFPVEDFSAMHQRLAEWHAVADPPRRETDRYFNAPDRDFGSTDEALRLRQVAEANLVTYKGPKRDALTKTRTEIEVPLGSGQAVGESFARILVHLGYRPTAVVSKSRRVYHLERDGFPIEVCLDEVDELGKFVELEIQAPEEQLEAARDVLMRWSAALGLTASERRSYLELLLLKRGKSSP